MGMKETILGANDVQRRTVEVPEWGITVTLQGMSGRDRNRFEDAVFKDDEFTRDNITAKVLVRCIVDETGKRLFVDSDADALGNKSASILTKLADIAKELSGIGAEAVEAEKKS